jgi:hypothetical protein
LHTLTRRALFDLVWTRPLTKIAADYGISAVALHKICDKHRVPLPGRGYWAKLAAGQKVPKALYREVSDAQLNEVRIFGSAIAQLPPTVVAAREAARDKLNNEQPGKAQDLAPIAEKGGGSEAGTVTTLAPMPALHPVAERLRRKLAGRRADSNGLITFSKPRLPAICLSPAVAARAVSLLDLLLSRAIAIGYEALERKEGLALRVDGEELSLRLGERLDRVPHVPTPKETADLARWEADKARRQKNGTWYGDWGRPRVPETDQVPSGLLLFGIDEGHRHDGLQRNFGDTQRRRLEDGIEAILAGMAACAAARKEKRAADEAWEKQWAEKERQRKDHERRVTLHKKRCEYLDLQMERLERVQKLRAFARGYRAEFNEIPEPTASLVLFATLLADHLQEEIAPAALAPVLEKHDLMNDDAEVSSWISFKDRY